MPKYVKPSIKKKFAELILEWIEKHPEAGYSSLAEFAEDAMRRRGEELGIFSYPSKKESTKTCKDRA